MRKLFKKIRNSKMVINIRFFIPLLFKLNPLSVICTILSGLIWSFSSLFWVYFPKEIIELLMDSNNPNQKQDLIRIVIIFVSIQFITNVLTKINDNIKQHYSSVADFKIDKMFNQKVSEIDYYYLEDPEFVDKLELAKKGLKQYSNGIYSILNAIENIIHGVVTLAGVIGIVLSTNQIIIIVLSLVGIIINSIVYSKYADYNEEFNTLYVRFNRKQWYFNSSMLGFRNQKNLRAYDALELIETKSKDINEEVLDAKMKINKKMIRVNLIDRFASLVLVRFLTLIILGYSLYYKEMTIATFTMLFSAIGTFSSCISNFTFTVKTYSKDCEYQSHFIDLMNIKPINKDGKEEISEIRSIEFRNVSFKYPRTENYILKNVSFKISNKEKVSLVGLNGAGKTTLIKLICRFFELDEGVILVNGVDIKEYNYKQYMDLISVVFQDFKIISYTIKDNVAIVDDDKDRLDDSLKRAQVYDKVESMPKKENTYINKWFDPAGVEFSGGEMQKFAIARALYKNSDFVILDEPTSALDPLAESEIYYHFNEVVGKKLTLFISHRLSSCIFSDKILVLDGSIIAEEGTHKELMSNKNGLYYKMFNEQAKYYE